MSDEPQIMLGVESLSRKCVSEEVRGGRCSVRRRNAWFGFRVRLAQRELEYSMKTDEFAIPPMRCRWGVRAQLKQLR